MKQLSHRETIIALEKFNPAKMFVNGVKAAAGTVVPNFVKQDVKSVSKAIQGDSPKSRRGGREKPIKKKERVEKTVDTHKYINNYLLANSLRSTKLSGLPTVADNKASGRFAIVD